MNTHALREEIILNITRLMLIFLPISALTNYFIDRPDFAILHLFIFLATIKHYFCFRHDKDLEAASEQILVILFGLFFAFFLIGSQDSFDILWILIFPVTAFMTSSVQRLKIWLVRFIFLVLISIALAYFFEDLVKYTILSLFSLLWASLFLSYTLYNYKKIQQKLEDQVYSPHDTLQSHKAETMDDTGKI